MEAIQINQEKNEVDCENIFDMNSRTLCRYLDVINEGRWNQ